MKHHTSMLMIAAVAAIGATTPLAAQSRSTVDAGTLDAAVITHSDRSRAAVSAALTTPRALAVAGSMGLSPEAVATRVGALDEAATRQLASEILAGGDSTVVLSTTAIIIGLLLLILLTRA